MGYFLGIIGVLFVIILVNFLVVFFVSKRRQDEDDAVVFGDRKVSVRVTDDDDEMYRK